MTKFHSGEPDVFDQYADEYDAALDEGISVSGEDKNYFARGRINWLSASLRRLRESPRRFMDYGCGTGSASPFIFEMLDVESIVGVDASLKSLAKANDTYGSYKAHFVHFGEYQPKEEVDIAFCNGVFHHIPPTQRAAAIDYIYRSVRPGGLFAFWENNPWNPGTRYVMSRIPFDRDAITLSPPEARRLLRFGGFQILQTDFLFIFPKALRWLRMVEPMVARLPIGAQYQILCRKRRS